ncbi:unnamed protein product [Closterium sp. Naga37s-1]|nr:unnamed protein product [Closterium sp. Naga37s-1]
MVTDVTDVVVRYLKSGPGLIGSSIIWLRTSLLPFHFLPRLFLPGRFLPCRPISPRLLSAAPGVKKS